jgi:hypothetical protein
MDIGTNFKEERSVAVGTPRKRRPVGRVARKRDPEAFTAADSFHYFVTELELIVASGRVVWTVASVTAARRRLVKLVATLGQIAAQSKENGSSS